MLNYQVSPGFRQSIQETRALRWMKTWKPSADEARFLRRALYQMDSRSTFPVDTSDQITDQIVRDYKHCGVVTQAVAADRLQFAFPLVRVILGQWLFTAPVSLKRMSKVDGFENFLKISISRMRPSALRESFSKSSDESEIFERAWQIEWFRAATTAAPIYSSVSPDVGPIFGATGFFGFYVNGQLQWGVELLREGERMKEHAKRFDAGGQYVDIPLNHWAIVDFRHESKELKNP